MKYNYLTPITVVLGLMVLFFFPEPETNFLAYLGTIVIFVIILALSIKFRKNNSTRD